MLRMFWRMLFVVAVVCLYDGAASAAGRCCGGGGASVGVRAGFHPLKNLRDRLHSRRTSAGASGQQSGECGSQSADAAFPQQDFGSAQPFTSGPGLDVPMPAAGAGAVAVFDGRTWQLVASKGGIQVCECGCMESGVRNCKNCCERTADPGWKANRAKLATLPWLPVGSAAPATQKAGYYNVPSFTYSPTWAVQPQQMYFGGGFTGQQDCPGGRCNLGNSRR